MKKIKYLLVALTLIILTGCGKNLTTKTTGDTMKITVDTDTSSNYVWSYSIMDSNVIDVKQEEFLTPADDETLDGEVQVFTFKAFSKGETEIILNYMNMETGNNKYDITYVIEVDDNKNITVKSKSGKYSKKLPKPVIYTETNNEN